MSFNLKTPLVSVSFDDRLPFAADYGAQALERRGWRGTFYTCTGFEGAANHLGALTTRDSTMSLAQSGHEIGNHTFSHIDCGRAGARDAALDSARNDEALKEWGLEVPITSFAFPYGEAQPNVKTLLGPSFATLRGIRSGINRTGDDLWLLKAVALDGGDAGIQKALCWIDALKQRPGWLILFTDDIRNSPNPWRCTPTQFEAVLDRIAEAELEVATVGEAAERFSCQSPGSNKQACAE